VQAEIFVLWLDSGRPSVTGPCGPAAWYLEVGTGDDPLDVVTATIRRVIGEPVVVHSTSWRRDREAVVLSFIAVIDATLVGDMESLPLPRADLARGDATSGPATIVHDQVVEHGLRHHAWLVGDDPVIADRLAHGWPTVLHDYVPEPFRNLPA
jgi:hypothetical protein